MILLIASAAIALGIIGLAIALRESPADRALGYPQGSCERDALERAAR